MKLEKKWQDFCQVLAGALSAGVIWALLRQNARRTRDKEARRRRRAAAAAAAAALAAKPKGAAEAAPRPAAEQTAHVSARSAPGEGPLYRVSENELIVHQLLLTGKDEIQFRDFASPSADSSGSGSAASPGGVGARPAAGGTSEEAVSSVAQQVKAAAEEAFFGLLRDALAQDPPQLDRLVHLVLDARDQLAELVPASTPEGQSLLAAIKEKLETDYVTQRLSQQGYDPGFLSQTFDFLIHLITELQAPARRSSTQERYGCMAARFAAAVAEGARARAEAAAAAAAAAQAEAEQEQAVAAAGTVEEGGAAAAAATAATDQAAEASSPDEAGSAGVVFGESAAQKQQQPEQRQEGLASSAEEGGSEQASLRQAAGEAPLPQQAQQQGGGGAELGPAGDAQEPAPMSSQREPEACSTPEPVRQASWGAAEQQSSAEQLVVRTPEAGQAAGSHQTGALAADAGGPAEGDEAEGDEAGQQAQQHGESVSVQFVVRESVQSVRLIMRVVQRPWVERHGSTSPAPPAALARASSTATPTPPAKPALSPAGSAAAAALLPPLGALGALPRTGSGKMVPSLQLPTTTSHHYRGPATSRGSHTARGSGLGTARGPGTARRQQEQEQQGEEEGGGPEKRQHAGRGSGARLPDDDGSAEDTPAAAGKAGPEGGADSGADCTGGPGRARAVPAPGDRASQRRQQQLSEAEVAALVGAARLMWDQLSELKSDVAKARLALLKEAITSGGSGIEYERRRYERALGGRPASGAMPLTYAWLRDTLLQERFGPGLSGPELVRACVAAGVLRLLQRPTAISPADCPETLLLDCRALVQLQNELQRVCLLVAAGLIARQVLAGSRVLLRPEQAAKLNATLKRRLGVLLSAGVNLEGISVELHHQLQHAAASAAQQAQRAKQADAAAAVRHGQAPEAAAAQAAAGAGDAPPQVAMEVVRRMVQRIFSTEDAVYRRVQAGVAAALSALLLGPSGAEGCQRALRGIGGEAALEETVQLGSGVDRIASLSAAVCQPYYLSMLNELEALRRGAAAAPAVAPAAAAAGRESVATAAGGR